MYASPFSLCVALLFCSQGMVGGERVAQLTAIGGVWQYEATGGWGPSG